MRRCARLAPAREGLDDDHVPAAARAWRADIDRALWLIVVRWRRDGQQRAGEPEAGFARGAGEQAVVADAVEAARQEMEEKAADELVGRERDDLLPIGPAAAIVLVAEGDAGLVEADQAA